MSYLGVAYFDTHLLAVLLELIGSEVGPIVRDDVVRYAKPKYYGLNKIHSRSSVLGGDKNCFDPFSKFPTISSPH